MPALPPPAASTNPTAPPPLDTGALDPSDPLDDSQPDPTMDSGVVLTTDQAATAGLADAQPGDTFTATLTVKSSDPSAGLTLDIADAKANKPDIDPSIPMPKQKTMGPAALFAGGEPSDNY